MTETRAQYALPELAIERPTTDLALDLLSVQGGRLTLQTTCAYIIGQLRDGLPDLCDDDLTRIAELYHAAVEELRERSKP